MSWVSRLLLGLLLLGLFWALAAGPALAAPQGPAAARGINLAGVTDYAVQAPFLDVMKSARRWIGHKPGQWGGVDYDTLVARDLLDEAGWPRRIPHDLAAIGTIVLTDLPEAAVSLAGRYVLSYEGSGIVEVSGRGTGQRYGPGEVRFDFTPGPGGVVVRINRSDPADPVRNIRIIREDRLELYAAGAVFNPDWTGRIGAFGTLRLMDWMRTNNATVTTWEERPKPGDATYTVAGVPLEILVRLANELGADPWFTLPHQADDAYFRQFATYVRDNLDPDRTAYVEYSNEVWNWIFAQTDWAEAQAMDRWGIQYSGVQYATLRAHRMAEIWRQVYGAAAADRLVLVLATQTAWLGRERDMLEAPLFQAERPYGSPAPTALFDAYAVTGYFNGLLGNDEKSETVRGWLAQSRAEAEAQADAQGLAGDARAAYVAQARYDLAVELAYWELRDGTVTGDPRGSLQELLAEHLPYHRAVADRHGLDLIMYEGGTHVTGIGAAHGDPELESFFIHLNYSPEMGDLYARLLDGWSKAGGGLFVHYADVSWPSRFGSWGALRFLSDQTPRWDVLTTYTVP